jgi:hypothetical protein
VVVRANPAIYHRLFPLSETPLTAYLLALSSRDSMRFCNGQKWHDPATLLGKPVLLTWSDTHLFLSGRVKLPCNELLIG